MLKNASFFREFAHVLSSMKKNGERALVFSHSSFPYENSRDPVERKTYIT